MQPKQFKQFLKRHDIINFKRSVISTSLFHDSNDSWGIKIVKERSLFFRKQFQIISLTMRYRHALFLKLQIQRNYKGNTTIFGV